MGSRFKVNPNGHLQRRNEIGILCLGLQWSDWCVCVGGCVVCVCVCGVLFVDLHISCSFSGMWVPVRKRNTSGCRQIEVLLLTTKLWRLRVWSVFVLRAGAQERGAVLDGVETQQVLMFWTSSDRMRAPPEEWILESDDMTDPIQTRAKWVISSICHWYSKHVSLIRFYVWESGAKVPCSPWFCCLTASISRWTWFLQLGEAGARTLQWHWQGKAPPEIPHLQCPNCQIGGIDNSCLFTLRSNDKWPNGKCVTDLVIRARRNRTRRVCWTSVLSTRAHARMFPRTFPLILWQ